MSNQSNLEAINTNISQINTNITNIYSTLNIISNSMLINQRLALLNDLRSTRPPPPPPIFSSNIFRPRYRPTTPSPLVPPNTSEQPNNTTSSPNNTTPSPNNTTSPNTSVSSREAISSFLSTIFRNEIPSGYGIGNMEISLMGLNPRNEDEEENIVISHHNIHNNTKIKLNKVSEDEDYAIEQCSICLEDIENNQIIREITKCKHMFHVTCADKWFEEHIKCPNCRQDIRIEIVS